MELRGRKKRAVWLWWAADRATQRVLGWALGDRDTPAARALGAQIPRSDSITYATDFWHSYANIFPEHRHVKGKAHTYTVESMNNQLRCHLARLRRKTHCYSKSLVNLRDSLLFVFSRCLAAPLIQASAEIECERVWEPAVSIPI